MKPVLFVTGHVPAYRVGALASLDAHEGIELALFGGRSLHGGPAHAGELPVPHRHVKPAQLAALAGSGRYRAVVCPTGGRLAPLATWAGARARRTPLILWASLWAHPRTLAHTFTYLPLGRLYRSADAVVTYGPHVSAYVRARGAQNVHVAPQSVDNDFWREAAEDGPPEVPAWAQGEAQTRFLFVGRADPGKGIESLLRAWELSGLAPPRASLTLVGPGSGSAEASVAALGGDNNGGEPGARERGILCLPAQPPLELRRIYAAADVLVLPSVATRNFREPWGLVVNEAMNASLAVLVSDAVGATAGGLVADGENGIVFPAGDAGALAGALERLAGDPPLRARLGGAGAGAVLSYSHEAWAQGFSEALAALGLSRGRW